MRHLKLIENSKHISDSIINNYDYMSIHWYNRKHH
jgi:hypothetical protein